MFFKLFVVFLAISTQHILDAQFFQPLNIAAGSECALVLPGGARSSAYDHTLSLFRVSELNSIQDPTKTCITYDAINAAYLDARKRIHVAQPKGEWKTEDIATVGELLLDISIQLARTYGLSYEDIENGLPQIDTTKTLIREICPPFLSGVECRPGKYRRFDGLCNNLEHPTWGATMTPFQRLIGPLYADGINLPRISVTGNDLPLSRVVSRTIHPDEGFHDHAGTVMVIAWGQFMDHDFTLTGTPLDPINRNDPEECCKRPLHLKHPYCNEIRIPDDDYFYRLFNVKCMDFVRAFPSPRAGCRLGSRAPFNTLTSVIDGNTIYGVKEQFSRKLRMGEGGLLRMNPVFAKYGLKDLLPLKLDVPDEGCTRPNKDVFCFEAGEIRVNEQLVLTCMHTMMARNHNRMAKGLAEVNPHWDDETLFQEARRINIAIIQHITYNEFLPILLGKDVMEKFGLVLNKEGHWDGYDPKVNPAILDSFASAAFRFGHTLLPTAVERWSKAHKFISSKRLSDLIRRPFDLYRAGVFDEYLMGLMNQVAQAMDDSITQEVTNHLFKKDGSRFGMDLVSFNMQRGREFGVPGYMEFRKFCGLPVANTWDDLAGIMTNETILRYSSIFQHPADIDLWSAGVSEKSLPGSMLGPTFACVIATQLSYIRRGDRFWYELPNQPSTFTPEQLQELRKAKLSRVICDNTDLIDTVQIYPMVLPDHEINPRVPCKSGIIPTIDLTKWADYGQEYGPHQYNVLNEIPNTVVTFISNKLERGKRSNRRQKFHIKTEEKPKEIEVYEYHETHHKGSDNPKHRKRGQAKTSVYNFRFKSNGDINRTSPRQRENIFIRKPKVVHVEGEAYELKDLANDDYFFEQLSKGKHSSETESESMEESNKNREVILLQVPANQKTEKHRIRKRPKVFIKLTPIKYEDTYDDYGVMDLEDASEEMQNSFEKEENIRAANLKVVKRKLKRKPDLTSKSNPIKTVLKRRPKQKSVHVTEVHNVPPVHRQRSKSTNFERIIQTSKLSAPDELHHEIDKIFKTKDKNYEKRGHDNSHWELKIVPKRYDDYTEV